MKFLETVRGVELEFNTEEIENKVLVNITIPEYGHWSRGAHYRVSELNEIIVKKLTNKNLVPLTEEGITQAKKTSTSTIKLEFKKPPKTPPKRYNKNVSRDTEK